MLRENGIEPVIIELNLENLRKLRADGFSCAHGDALHRDTLKGAGVENAVALILSSAGMHGSEEVIRLAREMNRDIRIIARANYLRDIPALKRAGADEIFSGEGEIALNMTERILSHLGATPEQIDRERERIRSELFGDLLPLDSFVSATNAATDDAEPDQADDQILKR